MGVLVEEAEILSAMDRIKGFIASKDKGEGVPWKEIRSGVEGRNQTRNEALRRLENQGIIERRGIAKSKKDPLKFILVPIVPTNTQESRYQDADNGHNIGRIFVPEHDGSQENLENFGNQDEELAFTAGRLMEAIAIRPIRVKTTGKEYRPGERVEAEPEKLLQWSEKGLVRIVKEPRGGETVRFNSPLFGELEGIILEMEEKTFRLIHPLTGEVVSLSNEWLISMEERAAILEYEATFPGRGGARHGGVFDIS
ncbi:MAG: hypothetical protein D084_Lepto4C00427G0001, partial [Leptospirillum sp. Group IV 'UBA BS']